jgi:hypothetical protein
MSEGSLFNSGFLGANFNWWIGQIASDSTWRDNILPGKFENKDQIPGWGRRYKVRIIGLHDQGETEIPSDQLPWAQIMYPVTAGGGQAGASQTANLRQGMFVFGFFLDEKEQQVPVIMGVLGNNAQTSLSTKIKDNSVTNTQSGSLAVSGLAKTPDGDDDPNIKASDEMLVIDKPKDSEQSRESFPPLGTQLDKYGIPYGKATEAQRRDVQRSSAEADARGLTGEAKDEFIKRAVTKGIKDRFDAANSPTTFSRPGATRENADAVHEQSNADTKRHDLYLKKTVMLSPCDMPSSAMKAIQIELDNLTREIDKILHTATSYIDAVSQVLSDIDKLISNFACIIAKYMKIIFDKIFEFVMKQINKAMAPTVDILYPNQRNRYLDIKEIITELIKCLYSKIINNLCGQIQAFLDDIFDFVSPSPCADSVLSVDETTGEGFRFKYGAAPFVPICSVENLTGSIIALNKVDIDDTVNNILENVNVFLNDIQKENSLIPQNQISSILDGIRNIGGISIPDINISLGSALSFENIVFNIFGCDLKANCPVSDYYTLQNGSGATEEPQQPRLADITKAVQEPTEVDIPDQVPFVEPRKDTLDLDYRISDSRSIEQIVQGTQQIS